VKGMVIFMQLRFLCVALKECIKLLLLLLLVVVVVVVVVVTAIELSLSGSSPYTSADRTNKNKYA
jgi:flagellar basal body-associated protein FliL